MNIESHHNSHFNGFKGKTALSLTVVLFFVVGRAWAGGTTVVCPSEKINDHLASLDKAGPNTLTISGECIELVLIEGFRDLTLSGGIIKRPTVSTLPGVLPALQVKGSERVNLSSMTFQEEGSGGTGNQPLVSILRSNVVLRECTVKGSDWGGLAIGDHSTVDIWSSTFEDNKGTGIDVGEDSRVNVSYVWWEGEDRTIIRRNGSGSAGGVGVNASTGAVLWVVDVAIQDNPGGAVTSNSGALINLGGWDKWAPTIERNGTPNIAAVSAGNSGEVWILPHTTIQNNPGDGVTASMGGRLVVCCGEKPADTPIRNNQGFGITAWTGGGVFFWGGALVEGNRRGGITLSAAEMFVNAALIQNNGDNSDPNSYGGVFIESNASAWGNFTIADNFGPGVFLKTGGLAIFLGNTSITRNKGYGVQLEMNAKAEFNNDNSVTGNKRYDLFCTSGSVAGAPKGARPTIGKMVCPGWTQLTALPAWATPR